MISGVELAGALLRCGAMVALSDRFLESTGIPRLPFVSGPFFTPDDALELEDIVLEEFGTRPYRSAKIPTILGKEEDWVLVLYQGDNRYWYDVRGEHHDPPRVRFRGYKPDSATRRGEYSERFEQSRE